VEEDHGRLWGAVLGGDAHVGDPGAGRELPEALPLHRSGWELRVTERDEGG
jgi:hypothetical protein